MLMLAALVVHYAELGVSDVVACVGCVALWPV